MTANKIFFKKITILTTILTLITSQNLQALEINDANIISLIQQRSLTLKTTQNTLNSTLYTFLSNYTDYNWSLGFDVSKTLDKSEVAPASPSLDINQDKFDLTLSKKYFTGTTLAAEVTRTWYKSEVYPSNTYDQDNISLNITQNLYPLVKNNNDEGNYLSASKDTQRAKLQSSLDEKQNIIDTLALYWKVKSAEISYAKNAELLKVYDQLAKSIRIKKKNSYAAAGELEQALVQYNVQKQNVQDLTDSLNSLKIQLKTALNIKQTEDITVSMNHEQPVLPTKFTGSIENTYAYKIQKLKTESAQLTYDASQTKGNPTLNAYAKINKQGLDSKPSQAFDEVTQQNHNKYVIGLTLAYPLDGEVYEKERAYKLSALQIEQEKQNKSKEEVEQNINFTWAKLQTAYQNIQNTQEIVGLRSDALKQIYMNYTQGRIDISNVLDAYNKKYQSEIDVVNALGTFAQTKNTYEMQTLTE